MIKRLGLVGMGVLALAACMPDQPPVAQMPQENCGAPELAHLVGKNAGVLSRMDFAQTVRIIRPGDAVTMDYSAERLNIDVDAGERIARVYCG